jgi:hypothetical protein
MLVAGSLGRRPWPSVTLRWRHLSLQVEGLSAFLRAGRMEVYARRRAPHDPGWAFIREPGSVEGYGFGVGLTVAQAPLSLC